MNRDRLLITVGSSICAHIWLLIFFWLAVEFDFFSANLVPVEQQDPIVFDLANAVERQKPKTVIETPDDAEPLKSDQADFLSDKSARARNEAADANLPIHAPFAKGDLKFEEITKERGPEGEQTNTKDVSEEPEQKTKTENDNLSPGDYYVSASEFNRDQLTNRPQQKAPGVTNPSQRARYDNPDSRAQDMGSLSFNTYDWDFAPYMLELKRKVERNIFPPPAFTRLGLISGDSIIKFRIFPNGTMKALEVVDYKGHKTLMETSYGAIELSAPFSPLPSDFPEPFLEVTARFTYSNGRN